MPENKTAKKAILMTVSDPVFRGKFLEDPVAAGTEAGLPEAEIEKLKEVNVKELAERLEGLDKLAGSLGEIAKDWSKDWNDGSNDHNKGDHDHNKNARETELGPDVMNPVELLANNPVMMREALKDPAVRLELESNVKLRDAISKLRK